MSLTLRRRKSFGGSSSSGSPRDAGNGFVYPRQYAKRLARKAWGVGNRAGGHPNGLMGAPSPSRYIFIYRVQQGDIKLIQDYCTEQGVVSRSVRLRSNHDAKYKSFVLEVSVDDYKNVLKDDFWPNGIHVRPYRENLRANIDTNDGEQ